MAEQLYTIPINEAFDEKCGCPLCRLRDKLETQSLNYIMGAAMMDPDIRIRTNELGFCGNHFNRMLSMGNRLSLALMLESHLKQVGSIVPAADAPKKAGKLGKIKKYDGETPAAPLMQQAKSCFVCHRAAEFEEKYVSNIVYIWKKDPEFREKFAAQPYFCLEHAAALLEQAKSGLSEANYLTFSETLMAMERRQLEQLHHDVLGFCRSFDHENAGKPLTEEQRYAVEHTIAYLAGEAAAKK